MMETDEVIVIEANYGTATVRVDGVFAVIPNPKLKELITELWGVK